MPRLAINGLGRTGKFALRALLQDGFDGEIVLLNDRMGDAATHAHLFEFDSVHGRWGGPVSAEGDRMIAGGRSMKVTTEATIEALPLKELGVDIVIDATGVFKTAEKTARYFEAGVRKVVVSSPIKDAGALNIVCGVNHHLYEPATHDLVTAAS